MVYRPRRVRTDNENRYAGAYLVKRPRGLCSQAQIRTGAYNCAPVVWISELGHPMIDSLSIALAIVQTFRGPRPTLTYSRLSGVE